MLTVDDFGQIRRAHRDGMSIRVIARTFHHSRMKVREALAAPELRPYTRTKDPPAPKLGPFKPIIDELLLADEEAARKQRNTAVRIFQRLQSEHGYAGSYGQVRRYVARHRRNRRETFIPLAHDPGRRQVPVFIAVWAYSNAPFAMAMTSGPATTGSEIGNRHIDPVEFPVWCEPEERPRGM